MRRGVTAIELMVVLGIVALVLAIAIPGFRGMSRRSELNEAMQQIKIGLQEARSWASSGREATPGVATRYAGLRFETTRRFVVFADRDAVRNGNEVDVETTDFAVLNPDLQATITAPVPGTELRFAKDGTATVMDITMRDVPLGIASTLSVNGSGHIRFK